METSHPLLVESFSYSWLVNLEPSSLEESLDDDDEGSSFIEMDPRMPPSRRFFINSQDLKFDFPTSQHSPLTTLVDADQLFSNGYLIPLFVESLNIEPYEYDSFNSNSNSNSTLPCSSSHVPKKLVPIENPRTPSLKRCRTLSRKMFQKYLNFLSPLCRRLRGQNSGTKHENVVKRTQSVKNIRRNYCESSPRMSTAYSCDSDSSIYEAVLHCKRSIGMSKKSKFHVYVNR
ncbi:hypothetical protein MtrunA17_Chr6g0462991 [Medicago truncatula]|uniref:Uncharacterized protein n=1 Tax=Medicago truncatula TaxID=3880 RepID=A0A396HE98_MEDTR|nr:hypothetical protein MtrunA17_Chr6g0462991 [Medicago truncatula]